MYAGLKKKKKDKEIKKCLESNHTSLLWDFLPSAVMPIKSEWNLQVTFESSN